MPDQVRIDLTVDAGARALDRLSVEGAAPSLRATDDLEDFDDAAFRALQMRLADMWPGMTLRTVESMDRAILVVSSITADIPALEQVLAAYEERYLFLVLALARSPRTHVVYVTSVPMLRRLVDYYLSMQPGDHSDLYKRLTVISIGDHSHLPLTNKILERPRVMARMRQIAHEHEHALLLPFMTTRNEAELALALDVPLYGTHPALVHLGTKTGSRSVFAAAGVPFAPGVDGVRTAQEVADAITALRHDHPGTRRFVVKIDDGVGGLGNALVEPGLLSPITADDVVRLLHPEDQGFSPADFLASLAVTGGVVEVWLDGLEVQSPSVQLRASPLRQVEVLSTHDQLLGGPNGQTFLGCEFPARDEFIGVLTRHGRAIGRELARRGVVGRFAVDFVMVRRDDGWHAYAIEINLRNGGTTHPALTLLGLTDGKYDEDSGLFLADDGPRYYVASDHVEHPEYRQLTPDDVLDLIRDSDIAWDPVTQVGVALHMVSAVAVAGRVGATAIGRTREEARDLFDRTAHMLDTAVGLA
ncbi:peptide ligase PGM1-related protein [Longivirga aurantiaca]|uniref:Peptide ligase PGM1-related protein n=1 Tax=Longivirga aurantiaca TaxID=1837743 RepID=A0ABW1T2R5_9ACTN